MTDNEAFSLRLNQMLDDLDIPKRGRLVLLAKRYGVTHPSARKWLVGEGYPDIVKLIDLAKWGKTTVDWLLTGRGLRHLEFAESSETVNKTLQLLKKADPQQLKTIYAVVSTLINQKDS